MDRRVGVLALLVLALGCRPGSVDVPAPPEEPSAAKPSPSSEPVGSSEPGPAIEGPTVRAGEVLRHADAWLGRELVVDVYEPVDGGRVRLPDAGGNVLELTPDRALLQTLTASFEPPFRVRATLRRHDRHQDRDDGAWRVLEVHGIEPLGFPEPDRAESAEAILRDPERWHGQYVVLEGEWGVGFEASSIQGLWVGMYPGVEVVCRPEPRPEASRRELALHRARIVGFVYTQGRYGHMGGYPGTIVATEVTYLDTPGCRPTDAPA